LEEILESAANERGWAAREGRAMARLLRPQVSGVRKNSKLDAAAACFSTAGKPYSEMI
jgi:hypothetical protein